MLGHSMQSSIQFVRFREEIANKEKIKYKHIYQTYIYKYMQEKANNYLLAAIKVYVASKNHYKHKQ